MKRSFVFLLSGAILASSTAVNAKTQTPDEQLARAIEGRVEGKAQDCLMQRDIRSSQIIDGKAIVYKMANGTVYVNQPDSGASSLRRDYVLVTNTHSDQLCSVDIVRLLDSGTHMEVGSLGLGKFVPYVKPARAAKQ
ncbi:hypothetical protein [Sphingosinicella microcystinivorans]|uniref:Uncharacterized protein n=1 Tax=Sphingosinicella microcystinivorans TaxID=335406 RepID=A0AAD1G0Z2_SPHMI|nr:hypothetical protein [Sphingosinicella microcystinivorans]RKS91201.1 hypothetical protein DFR51_0756 [Sphingosinicella microcystinivorans]BBE34169.1 hypothetical protein SmB9_18270 [Sphingosinicella microcystinivorans]